MPSAITELVTRIWFSSFSHSFWQEASNATWEPCRQTATLKDCGRRTVRTKSN